jgi:hypothetical protein
MCQYVPYVPCIVCIYIYTYVCTYIWVIYGVNVGKYSMEHLGMLNSKFLWFIGISFMFIHVYPI